MIILPIVRVIEFHFWSNFSDSVSIGIVHRIHIFSMEYRLEHRVASFCDYFIAFPIGFANFCCTFATVILRNPKHRSINLKKQRFVEIWGDRS